MSSENIAIVWFRNDLRVEDNAALYHASKSNLVIGIYLEATEQRKMHNDANCKLGFINDSVLALSKDLHKLNIPLHMIKVQQYSDMAEHLIKLAIKENAQSIWFNNEYLINEMDRDDYLESLCEIQNIKIHRFDCDLMLPPNSVRKPDGSAYKVFTPFKKAWIKNHQLQQKISYPIPTSQDSALLDYLEERQTFGYDYRRDLWPAGAIAASTRLKSFLADNKVENYKEDRDRPNQAGTSTLSPYLMVGSISARQCSEALLDYYHGDIEKYYSDTWLSELIWRDFYRQIIIDNPSLAKHEPFKKDKKEMWTSDYHLFNAWCNGQTGFPLIDAAMRQLHQTGWMHNRLRMNVAMFLNKLCLVDWRWGEKYFMQKLIDGDFASNNGGWQWCSSTGADSAPYFRIMSPLAQSLKFDPEGDFIKKFVPELSSLNKKEIHAPNSEKRKSLGYPEPIIDYKYARALAIKSLA